MKYFILSILIILVIVLGYYYQNNSNNNVLPNLQTLNLPTSLGSCQVDEDCQTPMEFLIQSNCPFASACIQNHCQVICPMVNHDSNPEISKSWPVTCQVDEDCNCSGRENRSLACLCHQGYCLSVETN